MKTHQRLDQAYKNAFPLPLGNSNRIIIFSDAHRGDNSAADEFAHNQSTFYHALEYYYKNEFTYIEAGDGDELWEHKSFTHIREAHSDVYLLLKRFYDAHRLYLIYGNHNLLWKSDTLVKRDLYRFYDYYTDTEMPLFTDIKVHEAIRMDLPDSDQDILILHGHQGDLMNDKFWFFSMFMFRYFWKFMHIVGFRNPASPAKNVHKQHKIERNFIKWIERTGVPILCGHTHRPKFPSNGDMPYINSGCCVHPRGITGIEIADGQIALVNWKISPDTEGVLAVRRNVMRGPLPLTDLNTKKTVTDQ